MQRQGRRIFVRETSTLSHSLTWKEYRTCCSKWLTLECGVAPVILFVDDLGYNEINTGAHAPVSGGYSGYGGKVATPHIER